MGGMLGFLRWRSWEIMFCSLELVQLPRVAHTCHVLLLKATVNERLMSSITISVFSMRSPFFHSHGNVLTKPRWY